MKIDEKLIEAVMARGNWSNRNFVRGCIQDFIAVMRERREEVVEGMAKAAYENAGRVIRPWGALAEREQKLWLVDAGAAFDHLFPENPQ